ncbi:hypothetical protein HYC85_000819 [Camellia sinensis]|uniref:C2 domain-containing protein n=1 Tax=Camellia sinensis TaxID=4442 RepID=A0A7J7I3K6_CAMSI|nr:hypothetical protein HYC85_000819 [Camellia sinensis]
MDVDTFNLSQKLKTHVIRKYINPEWNKDLTLSISDLDLPIKLEIGEYELVDILTPLEKTRFWDGVVGKLRPDLVNALSPSLLSLSFRESTQQRQHVDQNNASMELINSVTGTDEEGQSRQRILTFASRRYVRRIVFEGLIVDPDQGEFLCPVGTMDLQIQHCLHYL